MLYNLFENRDFVSVFAVALLAEGVDRNLSFLTYGWSLHESPSSRRAWIEIRWPYPSEECGPVALLAEGVDRNLLGCPAVMWMSTSPSSRRAWIEIDSIEITETTDTKSPSSRRAWIEILLKLDELLPVVVALLAEGVDRNWLIN